MTIEKGGEKEDLGRVQLKSTKEGNREGELPWGISSHPTRWPGQDLEVELG